MTHSIWPSDHRNEPRGGRTVDTNELSVFVICPSQPRVLFDGIFELVKASCDQLAQHLGVSVDCKRAIDITSAGVIHPEIWQAIRDADIIVADITGCNGNVMMELGVAAAWHPKERVIIIRQDADNQQRATAEQRLFDISPARQTDYLLTPRGFERLRQQLFKTIQDGLAAAPFRDTTPPSIDLPTTLDFRSMPDSSPLWGPGMAHRRLTKERFLEFGSLYNFRHSWLCVGDVSARNIRVKAHMKFRSPRATVAQSPWIGIMVRSQGYLANFGHLIYLKHDGSVWVTLERDGGREHDDEQVGQLINFDPEADEFLRFEVSMDESRSQVGIGDCEWERAVSDLPYVYAEGRVLLQGFFTWVGLRDLEVQSLPGL